MKLYGYDVERVENGWLAIKPGENGNIPDQVSLFVGDNFLEQENSKENPLKETRLLDLIYLRMLNGNAGGENQDE